MDKSVMRLLSGMLMAVVLTGAAAAGDRSAKIGFGAKLAQAAIERTGHTRIYDAAYRRLAYPMGDVPDDRGVCTDVVIRAYRKLGIDLQVRVHEDMRAHFSAYPKRWGLRRTDRNIDHRRVPNLRTFFRRHGESLKVSDAPGDYKPGDLVSWDLTGRSCCGFARLPHIGIVTARRSKDGSRPLIVHNIGAGTRLEDMLFDFTITGHYRYGR